MALVRGLRKIFTKHDRFASPHQYRLTSAEQESVVVFFAIMAMAIIGGSVIWYIH